MVVLPSAVFEAVRSSGSKVNFADFIVPEPPVLGLTTWSKPSYTFRETTCPSAIRVVVTELELGLS
nr:hypothetical protein OG999_20735 [Streptomyces sp. NBC_00886]